MAFYDNTLLLSNAQAIGSATNVASTTTYDVTGAGVGNAPSMVWGTSTFLAADVMVGRPMYAYFTVTTAFSAGASTFTIAVQAAPPAAGNVAGTWTTIYQSSAFTGTQLTANAQLVAPIPPFALIKNAEALPRFYRFFYTTSTATFSSGTFSSGILLDTPTGFVSTLYPSNFASGL
jgi:hypothetical protein